MGETVESIKKALRSVLMSSKDGVRVTKLQGEYKELYGAYIPHSQMGFNSLDDFLSTLTDTVRKGKNRENEWAYFAIADSTTQHIYSMVQKQRPKKLPKRKLYSSFYKNKSFKSQRIPLLNSTKKYNNFAVTLYSRDQVRKVSYRNFRPNSSSKSHPGVNLKPVAPRFIKKTDEPKSNVLNLKQIYMNPLNATSQSNISNSFSKLQVCQENDIPETANLAEIKVNLHKLLSANKRGLFSTNIAALYKETFKEELPEAILKKIISNQIPGYALVEEINVGTTSKFILLPFEESKVKKETLTQFPMPLKTSSTNKITVDCHSALTLGEDYRVTIRHVVNCQEIYVTLQSEEDTINKMQEEIKQQLEISLDLESHLIKIGSYVIWKPSLRGRVKALTDKVAEVFEIDHGDTNQITIDLLRLMPTSISKYPEFMIKCSMNRRDSSSNWSDDTGRRFYDLYANKQLMMKPMELFSSRSVHRNITELEHSVFFYENQFNINFRLIHEEAENELNKAMEFCDPLKHQPSKIALFPDEQYCDVYVFTASCTTEIEVCIIGEGFSDQLADLEERMLEYYTDTKDHMLLPEALPLNCVYAMMSEDTCIRARLISIEGEQGNVYLVDNGEVYLTNLSNLRPLTEEFAAFPLQVITICLAGLDHVMVSTHSDVLQLLDDAVVHKTCTAHIVGRFCSNISKLNYVVELMDTSGPNDVNINEMCSNVLYEHQFYPLLPEIGCESKVARSYIDVDSGHIFVRVDGSGLQTLTDCLMKAQKTFEEQKIQPSQCASNLYPGKICLVQTAGSFHRVKVVQICDGKPRGITVFFIDVGKHEQVSKGSLFKIKVETLFTIPPQAVCCKLSFKNLESNYMASLDDVAKEINSSLFMRMDEYSVCGEPHLVSFKREQIVRNGSVDRTTVSRETNKPIPPACDSKNVTAIIESTTNKDLVKSSNPTAQIEVAPALFGSADLKFNANLFPVKIEAVLSPNHLQVIALRDLESRVILTRNLSYHNNKYPAERISFSDILVGGKYALLQPNRDWYRVEVLSKMDDVVSVYAIDYGGCCVVGDTSCFRRLANVFTSIPGIMITAKLARIHPVGKNVNMWPEVISTRLRNLTKEKRFIAHLLKAEPDKTLNGRKVAHICLCDTTVSPEVWINDLLVDEWRCATYVN